MEKIPISDKREEQEISLSLQKIKDQLATEIARLRKEGGDKNWTKEQKEIIKKSDSAIKSFLEFLYQSKSTSKNRREVMATFMSRGNSLKEKMEALSLKPDEYRLYHVLAGSSPHPSVEIKYFDTKDHLIENFLTNDLLDGLYKKLEEDGGDEDGDGSGKKEELAA